MSSKMSVKLLVDKKSQKVVFAEAGKEFVDFLFNLLAMPVGTVAKLLKKDRMVGSIGNLYNSVESLSEAYLEPNKPNKSTASLLQLQLPTSQRPLLLSNPTTPKSEGTLYYFRCYSHKSHTYVTHNSGTLCPICLHQMTTQMTYVGTGTAHMNKPGGDEGSIVRGVVTYMIMDDLSVTPMSTISGVKLLNKFNISEIGLLQEKVVRLGIDEGLALLKASLQSNTVLTDVFLAKKILFSQKKRGKEDTLKPSFQNHA